MWFRFDPELTVLSQNHEATDMESLPWSQWPERQNSNNSPDRISCESESAHFGAGNYLAAICTQEHWFSFYQDLSRQ